MNILLALDGSEISEHAALGVASLGDIAGEVRLLMVLDPRSIHGTLEHVPDPPSSSLGVLAPAVSSPAVQTHEQALAVAAEESKAYLRRVAARTLPGRAVVIQVELSAQTAEAILTAARAASANLIAMGTHGRGGMRRVLAGSVTERVVRTSPIPVLVIGPANCVKEVAGRHRRGEQEAKVDLERKKGA